MTLIGMAKNRMGPFISFTIPALEGNEELMTETLETYVDAFWWDGEGVLSGLVTEENQVLFEQEVCRMSDYLNLPPLYIEFFPFDPQSIEQPENPYPFTIGPFFVHGPMQKDLVPKEKIGIQLRSTDAFGAGDHETTASCIEAIIECSRFPISRALDVGCGTGILAIAIALLSPQAQVYACDCSEKCVTIARIHAFVNSLKNVHVVESDGMTNPRLKSAAPYELIVANIHSNLLCELAPQLASSLTDDGHLILSGLLASQEDMVIEAYAKQGKNLHKKLLRGEWRTLVFSG